MVLCESEMLVICESNTYDVARRFPQLKNSGNLVLKRRCSGEDLK